MELIANCLSAEQLQLDSASAAPTVLAAQSGPKSKANPFCKEAHLIVVCSNKMFCGETGHTIDTCIKLGGGMAGKTLDEAKVAKRAKAGGSGGRSGLNSLSKAYVTLCDSAGNTCYMVNGQLLYPFTTPVSSPAILTTAANPFPQTFVATSEACAAPVHYSGLSSDSISSVLSPGDQYELRAHVTFADNLRTSVDWSQYRHPVDLANIAVTPTPATGRLPLSHAEYPFLLDSGANVSISSKRADFATLQPISPHPICGVGGTSVSAIGVWTIHLILGKGRHLDVDNVLFVPSAPLRLLSVLLINCGGSCTSHFGSTLTNTTGSTVASGYITSCDLYILSTSDISTSHDYSAHVATTAQADLDTWHYRLGHANRDQYVPLRCSRRYAYQPLPSSCQMPTLHFG